MCEKLFLVYMVNSHISGKIRHQEWWFWVGSSVASQVGYLRLCSVSLLVCFWARWVSSRSSRLFCGLWDAHNEWMCMTAMCPMLLGGDSSPHDLAQHKTLFGVIILHRWSKLMENLGPVFHFSTQNLIGLMSHCGVWSRLKRSYTLSMPFHCCNLSSAIVCNFKRAQNVFVYSCSLVHVHLLKISHFCVQISLLHECSFYGTLLLWKTYIGTCFH